MAIHDWPAIVQDQGPLVWQTAYRLLGDHADAADCFQETFLAAFEIAGRQPVRNMGGLLVHLATTRAIDRLRQKSRRQRQAKQLLGQTGDGREIDTRKLDPPTRAEEQELTGRLRDAIVQLPPQEAKVFCLRHLNEMSYREIARELNMNVGAVGVALHRAKAKLREALDVVRLDNDEVPYETR